MLAAQGHRDRTGIVHGNVICHELGDIVALARFILQCVKDMQLTAQQWTEIQILVCTAEELQKRTLVRRIKEHYTGKFGTAFVGVPGLLSLGDPLSAFQPTPSVRVTAYHKPSTDIRRLVKSKTFTHIKPVWTGGSDTSKPLDSATSVLQQQTSPEVPDSTAETQKYSRDSTTRRQTSVGELRGPSERVHDRDFWQQASLQSRPATAAPDLVIPSACAPERSILHDAESGDAASQETVVRVLLSSFMKPEALPGVLLSPFRCSTHVATSSTECDDLSLLHISLLIIDSP